MIAVLLMGLAAFWQGILLILIPAASVILRSPTANHLSQGQYGVSFISVIVMVVVSTLQFKPWVRRYGTAALYRLSFVMNGLYLAVLACVPGFEGRPAESFGLILAANAFLGTGFGLGCSIMNLAMVEWFPQKRNASVVAIHALIGLGMAASPFAVSFFDQRGLWSGAVMGCLVLGAMILAAWTFVGMGSLKGASHAPADTGERKTLSKRAWPYLLMMMIYGIIESIMGNWAPVYMESRGVNFATLSAGLSAFWLCLTFGRMGAGLLALKGDTTVLYPWSPALMAAVLAAFLWIPVETIRPEVLFALMGLGCSYFFPMSVSLASWADDQQHELISSLSLAMLMTGVGIGSSLVGVFRALEILSLTGVMALAFVFALLLELLSLRKQ